MLSSPLELWISCISADQLSSSGNSVYLQLQLLVERQQQRIGEMKMQIQGLKKELVEWKKTCSLTAKWDLLSTSYKWHIFWLPIKQWFQAHSEYSETWSSHQFLPTFKDIPPLLDPKDHPNIHFWTAKAFEAYFSNLTRDTDGLAIQQRRRGRWQNDKDNKDHYPYLEDMDSTLVPWEVIIKIEQKARQVWHTLYDVDQAPPSWGKASETAYHYFTSEMLNVPEFEFFRYCKGNWKVMRWVTKA